MAGLIPILKKTGEIEVSSRDILFECPSCGKSLLVDEVAEGLIIECPQCRRNVIVPPKPPAPLRPPPSGLSRMAPPPPPDPLPASPSLAPSPIAVPPPAAAPTAPAIPEVVVDLKPEPPQGVSKLYEELVAMDRKLKEFQTQRTDLTSHIASRLNEINRDLVMLARLETTQQQLFTDWTKILGQVENLSQNISSGVHHLPAAPSASAAAKSRVTFNT